MPNGEDDKNKGKDKDRTCESKIFEKAEVYLDFTYYVSNKVVCVNDNNPPIPPPFQ